ncbi:MAG: hypothetical protein AUK03_11385 [Anaerolineae bacterium CG2_30_64_16]|nr:MAG: hypothetical protein AUK03_11385 [Anaerolineae bacterium CG2_30_64_16]
MKFLILGLGSMGKRRVRCIHALRAGESIGMDPRAGRREEAERLYGIRTVASFEEGMAADPDAVVICTPPNQHVSYGLAALKAGKPFFAEETVTLDPTALTPLIDAIAAHGLLGAPSCTMRFHPGIRYVKQALDRGEVGEPLSFTAMLVSYLPDWHPWERVEDYYVSSRLNGGGREMVAFEMDWMEWLFGPVTAVAADVGKLSDIPADIDDTFQMLCRFASGVRGTVTVSVAYRVPVRAIELCARDGQIGWDSRTHRVMVYTAKDERWQHLMETASRDYSYDRMYIDEFGHFLQALAGEATYMRDFRDVQRLLEVVNAVEQSAVLGQRVGLARQ